MLARAANRAQPHRIRVCRRAGRRHARQPDRRILEQSWRPPGQARCPAPAIRARARALAQMATACRMPHRAGRKCSERTRAPKVGTCYGGYGAYSPTGAPGDRLRRRPRAARPASQVNDAVPWPMGSGSGSMRGKWGGGEVPGLRWSEIGLARRHAGLVDTKIGALSVPRRNSPAL